MGRYFVQKAMQADQGDADSPTSKVQASLSGARNKVTSFMSVDQMHKQVPKLATEAHHALSQNLPDGSGGLFSFAPLKKGITAIKEDESPEKDEELAAAYNAQWKRSFEQRQEIASEVIHVRDKIAQVKSVALSMCSKAETAEREFAGPPPPRKSKPEDGQKVGEKQLERHLLAGLETHLVNIIQKATKDAIDESFGRAAQDLAAVVLD